ncbi:MAG: TonB-dependent receptor [Terriglobales bacterium]|jgi:outer membrane receptor protein involved in Fe transport
MNSTIYRFLTLIAVLSLVSIGLLHAQTAVTGGIEGNVTDPSGAAISGATVEATNIGDSVTHKTVTNNDGAYRFPSLIPGTYSVTVKKDGFAQFTRESTRIDAGIGVRIDAKLPVGGASAKVEVTGEAPLLQTDSAEINETIHSTEISSLPTLGNNITRLSLLAPGVSMPSGQLDLHPENAGSDFNLNINGAAPNANGHLLDGVENTEAIQGLSIIVAPNDSVQEVKLATSDYDAEYGKVAGGLWQITTKSGTNAFHGTLFENYRTSGFNAADHFTEPNGIPGNRWNQFGGSIGGPVIKDKVFFFGDYQGMRNNLHASGNEVVPIDAFRTGDFSSVAAIDPIYDPATGNPDGTGRTQFDGCPGSPELNVICPTRLSTAAKNLLALLPQPNYIGSGPQGTGANYQISSPATFDQDQFDTRADYFVTSKTVVFGKFSYFKANFNTPTAYGVAGGGPPLGGIGVANAGLSADHDKSLMFDYQHTFSPTLLTDARFAFSRLIISELQPDYNTDAATAAGIPNINLGTVYTSGLPEISVSDPLTSFSMGDFGLPFFEREANFEFYDNWTKTVGHHAFKWGGEVGKFFGIRTDVSGRGAFNISQSLTQLNDPSCTGTLAPGNYCGSGLAAFELGLLGGTPYTFNRDITLVQPQEKLWKIAFYGQDTWQVTPRLTLTLGLRWDYMSPIFTQNGQSDGNIDIATDTLLLTNLAGKYAGVTTPKTEFSPRLGVSFRLTDHTVVRGGYGRSYYMNADGAGFGTQGCCWPIKQSQTDVQANPFAPQGYTLDQGPGAPPALPAFPANGKISFQGAPGGSEYFVGVGTYPHSYNDTYNVTLEHAFPYQITASVAYVGNIGRHLWDNYDVNLPPPGPGAYTSREPFFASYGWAVPEYQRNNADYNEPEMRSNYNSLQLHAEKRFHQGLYLLSNFTWAKSLDVGTFGPGDGNGNQFCFHCNYGPSGTVRPWSWVSAANWELPLGHGKAYANGLNRAGDAVVGGWALSGIFNFEAGQYFTPYNLGSPANLNSPIYDRPDQIGNPHVSHPNRNEWYNPAAYTEPPQYTFGDAGRNSLLGPGLGLVDLSLTKSIAITEKTHVDLKWDAFNALNRVNLNTPTCSGAAFVDYVNAGQICSIVDFRRRMQLGAHLTF